MLKSFENITGVRFFEPQCICSILAHGTLSCAGGKLASLEEFRVQRDELISETTQLEAMLQEQEKLHQQQIYDLEKKQVIDKDR